MDLELLFKNHLLSQNPKLSFNSVKNYLADIHKFILWYESSYNERFSPRKVNIGTVLKYKKHIVDLSANQSPSLSANLASRSFNRYVASLRRFFSLLQANKLMANNPLEELAGLNDPYYTDSFKNFLFSQRISSNTVKNYLVDVHLFLYWYKTTYRILREDLNVKLIDQQILLEYRERLLKEKISSATINRRFSGLMKYLNFLRQKNIIKNEPIDIIRVPYSLSFVNDVNDISFNEKSESTNNTYSSFGPVRFFQRIYYFIDVVFDNVVIFPLSQAVLVCQYFIWLASGKKLFVPANDISPHLNSYIQAKINASTWTRKTRTYSTAFYKPLDSRNNIKDGHNIIKLLKRYVSSPRFSAFLLMISFLMFGIIFYIHQFLQDQNKHVLGIQAAQRLLTVQGRLTNALHQPINSPTPVRFALYNDPTATKSAMLWEAVETIEPASDGSFQTTLGQHTSLPESVFFDNPAIFLGTTIGTDSELRPREEIPTSSLSNNSQTLNGMGLLNQTAGAQHNVVLALDSSGNLAIGGSSSPIFSSSNGSFTISGLTTILTTNASSNGNIVLAPNGSGMIDVQKALTNTSNSGNFADMQGAVEVDDALAILATSSAKPALRIEQDGVGDLISASDSGLPRFTVDYLGSGTFEGNLTVNGNSFLTNSPTFSLLPNSLYELDIGTNTNTIKVGSTSGLLTIQNATTNISGNLEISGQNGAALTADSAGISFTGPGNHIIEASQGALLINNATLNNPTFSSLNTNNINTNSIVSQGNVAIGKNQGAFRLDVLDDQASTVAAMISNTNSTNSPTASVLGLMLGKGQNSSNHFIDFINNGTTVGSIGLTNAGIQVTNQNFGDFAEYLPKKPQEAIPSGAIVCFGDNQTITQCNQTYSKIAGVVSSSPTILSGKNMGDSSVPVGFVGQIFIRASTENGNIKPGDPISVSDISGVGTKAITAGPIIGRALQEYDQSDPYIIGSILTLVQPSWFDPGVVIANNGNLSINLLPSVQAQSQSYGLFDQGQNLVKSTAAFGSGFIASLESGIVTTKDLLVENSATFLGTVRSKAVITTELSTNNLLIAGVSLQDYVSSLINQSSLSSANQSSAQIKNINVDVISPIGSSSGITVNGNMTTIGDSSVSGRLTSNQLQTADATISGVLRAHKIIADELDLSGENVASKTATYITNVTNIYATATPSATPTPDGSAIAIATSSSQPSDISLTNLAQEPVQTLLNDINSGSVSALLHTMPTLEVTNETVTGGFMNTGVTSLADTAVSGQLSFDNHLTLTTDSININGTDLQIQPQRQGGISFLSGLFKIDSNGDLLANGNAIYTKNLTVEGSLITNNISPLSNGSDNNLTIKLSTTSGLLINNASNSAVVSFNNSGDIQSSGSGNFSQLVASALSIVHAAQADISSTETVATASAGTAIIHKGQIERTIITPFAKATSLIYITPTSDTNGLTPYIARQTDPSINPGDLNSFTIQISSPAQNDIHMNWVIVN